MRDRKDFIENLQLAHVHLMILREDIRYPLSEERQKFLDYAYLLLDNLIKLEMKDDLMACIAKRKEEEDEE